MDSWIAAICSEPDDDLPRLIYADWLDDRGDPLGEFIRLQLAHHAGEPCDVARMSELEKMYGRKWAGPFADWAYMVGFRRGFPEHLVIPAEVFLDFADEIFKIAPIRGVSLIGAARKLRRLVDQPAMAHLRALHLTGTRIGDRGVGRLANCAQLATLQVLRLGHCEITDKSLHQLCESPHLTSLKELDLADNQLRGETICALANSDLPARLTRLDLRNNEFKPFEIDKLRQLIPSQCQLLVDQHQRAGREQPSFSQSN